jgi:hypothetical protein
MKNKLNNRGYKQKGKLGDLIKDENLVIQGPANAFLVSELGHAVDGLENALPGDVMQMWTKSSYGWSGHQGVIAFVHKIENDTIVGLMASNKDQIGWIQTFGVDDDFMAKGNASTTRSRVFIARPAQSSTGICKE